MTYTVGTGAVVSDIGPTRTAHTLRFSHVVAIDFTVTCGAAIAWISALIPPWNAPAWASYHAKYSELGGQALLAAHWVSLNGLTPRSPAAATYAWPSTAKPCASN